MLFFKVCFYELWRAGGLWSGCNSWCWISSQLCPWGIKVWLAFLILISLQGEDSCLEHVVGEMESGGLCEVCLGGPQPSLEAGIIRSLEYLFPRACVPYVAFRVEQSSLYCFMVLLGFWARILIAFFCFYESLGVFHVLMTTCQSGDDFLYRRLKSRSSHNRSPANYGLLPVFVNEVLLEYNHAIDICDHVGRTVAKLGGCQRGHSILKAQNTAWISVCPATPWVVDQASQFHRSSN